MPGSKLELERSEPPGRARGWRARFRRRQEAGSCLASGEVDFGARTKRARAIRVARLISAQVRSRLVLSRVSRVAPSGPDRVVLRTACRKRGVQNERANRRIPRAEFVGGGRIPDSARSDAATGIVFGARRVIEGAPAIRARVSRRGGGRVSRRAGARFTT